MTKYDFSLSRLWLVAKRDIMENWKKNIYNCLTLYAIFAVTLVFMMLRLHGLYGKIPNGFWVCVGLVVVFGWAVVLSNVMEPMRSKAKRIAFLMLPATNFEKYLWRLVYVTAGFAVSLLIALAATDLTYLLITSVTGFEEYRSILATVSGYLFGSDAGIVVVENKKNMLIEDWLAQAWFWMFILWGYSLFVLGGTVWSKHAFAKTVGGIILAFLVFLMAVQWVPVEAEHSFYEWLQYIAGSHSRVNVFFASVGTAFFAMTVLNLWIGFRMFKRSQIVGFKKERL